jgi:hypothetical protein
MRVHVTAMPTVAPMYECLSSWFAMEKPNMRRPAGRRKIAGHIPWSLKYR